MSRKFDFIILGCTGFTGKHCVFHAPKLLTGYKWAVAGRSEWKVNEMLEDIGMELGEDVAASVPILIADVTDYQSLVNVTKQCRVLINCCGPFVLYGEPVVRACISTRTDYVDVTAEPQFMEKMQLQFDETCQEQKIFVVNGCGFDSILSEMGMHFAEENFSGTLHSVEMYIRIWDQGPLIGAVVNYGTWHSLIHVYSRDKELAEIRRELFGNSPFKFPKPQISTKIIHKSPVSGRWHVPYANIDQSVSERTQRYFYEKQKKRPVQLRTYYDVGLGRCVIPSAIAILVMTFLYLITRFQRGIKLLLDYPKIFSLGQTSKAGALKTKYATAQYEHILYCKGWATRENDTRPPEIPTHQLIAKVSGRNPAYGTTCICLLLSARTLIEERELIPGSGGVLTPGVAFGKTDLRFRLMQNGIQFEIIEEMKEIQ